MIFSFDVQSRIFFCYIKDLSGFFKLWTKAAFLGINGKKYFNKYYFGFNGKMFALNNNNKRHKFDIFYNVSKKLKHRRR